MREHIFAVRAAIAFWMTPFIVLLIMVLLTAVIVFSLARGSQIAYSATLPHSVTLTDIEKAFGRGVFVVDLVQGSVPGADTPPQSSAVFFVGQVYNNTRASIFIPNVKLAFYRDSEPWAFYDTNTDYQFIPAGVRSPFYVELTPSNGWTTYKAWVTDYKATSYYNFTHRFSFRELATSWIDSRMFTIGRIKNESSFGTHHVKIISACYDTGNRLVGLGTYHDPEPLMILGPGQEASFSVPVRDPLLPTANLCLVSGEGLFD